MADNKPNLSENVRKEITNLTRGAYPYFLSLSVIKDVLKDRYSKSLVQSVIVTHSKCNYDISQGITGNKKPIRDVRCVFTKDTKYLTYSENSLVPFAYFPDVDIEQVLELRHLFINKIDGFITLGYNMNTALLSEDIDNGSFNLKQLYDDSLLTKLNEWGGVVYSGDESISDGSSTLSNLRLLLHSSGTNYSPLKRIYTPRHTNGFSPNGLTHIEASLDEATRVLLESIHKLEMQYMNNKDENVLKLINRYKPLRDTILEIR